MSMRSSTAAILIAAAAVLGLAAGANAQSAAETARQFAPSGKLRVEGKDYVVEEGDILNVRFAV